ncbi:hemerythrin [Stenotrophomonas sp. MYb238]|uniref:hemerythrin domain-containing protein n=1 Tax=Stenotrophomonas sp. MYb238 TaxID=2040281 RepID=UPI0012923C92|nr:hemerythrin domain-containing protein [Stenotrophomonas sp. MYb238]MQP74675.1 hemerythrin [Stenotrophomonas sp. MYb238]
MKAKTTKAATVTKTAGKTARAAGKTAAGKAQTSPRVSAGGQDAVALLKADHRQVEQMFARCAATDDPDDKSELVRNIGNALVIHAMLEEEIFYPACREGGIEDAVMDEAQVEHDTVGMLVMDLTESSPEAPYYDAKVKVLGEYVQLHVREEEKPSSGIFAKAVSAGLDMAELGERLKARKQELELQAEAEGVIPPISRSLGTQRYSDHGDMNMARYNQERDDQGRFVSDDDRRYSSQGRQDDDDRRYGRSRYEDDDRSSRGRSDDDRGGRYSRSRDDDDRGGSSRSRGDDDRGGSSRGGHGGWFGDPEGHARASERGWEGRRNDDDDRGGRYSRSRYDDDRGGSSRSRYEDDRGGSSRGGHGGWFGDPEGHARAAERGWEGRRDDDDDRGRRSSRGR